MVEASTRPSSTAPIAEQTNAPQSLVTKPIEPNLMVSWELLPEDYPLPDDPVENIQQPRLAAALTDALTTRACVAEDCLIASNFALVAKINKKTVVKAPDWLYVPHIHSLYRDPTKIRRSYTPRLEGDPVAIVMEFLSEDDNAEYSARPLRPYGKLFFYEQVLQVPTYVIFDPATARLEVRRLEGDRYQRQEPNEDKRYWIPELNLFLGVWSGFREQVEAHWLRWWDSEGNLLLWSAEAADLAWAQARKEAQRAEQEAQRATQAEAERDRLLAKLREMGIDP